MQAYRIEITQVDGPAVARAEGDLDTIAYVARKAKDTMAEAKEGSEFTVYVSALSEIAGTPTRTVTAVTADAEVAAYVLTKRITAERKVTQAHAVENAGPGGDAE